MPRSSRLRLTALRALGGAAALAVGCSGAGVEPGGEKRGPGASGTDPASPPRTFVSSVNERGTPSFLWASRPVGGHARTATPEAAARAHLQATAAQYRLSPAAVAAAEVIRVDDSGNEGVLVVFRQKIGDVEVLENDAKVLMNGSLDLLAIGGALHPAGFPQAKLRRFAIAGDDAIARALVAARPDGAVERLRAPRARRIYVSVGQALVPAYVVETFFRAAGPDAEDEAHETIVAADDGRVLRHRSLTQTDAAKYRVFADADGRRTPADGPLTDTSPYPLAEIDHDRPAVFAAPNLVTIDGFNSKLDPWLPPGGTETKGNNVDVYSDDENPAGFSDGDLRATMTSPGVFDRTYDPALQPTANPNQIMAAVTAAFYTTNWLHDDWYDAGFDEAAGNAQADNYGRGGQGGDRLIVRVQFGAGNGKLDNANASTPGDGESPMLRFYLFSPSTAGPGAGIRRDSAIDAAVVAHEWGHYLHYRLVGGTSKQVSAQSEGWADFVALHMMLRPSDALRGHFAVGAYTARSLQGGDLFWGIRRFAYSVDPAANGLTFKHITDGVALPPGPMNGAVDPLNSEVHNAGEVWASALFEGYIALLGRAAPPVMAYSFEEARRRMARYAVSGMKLAPSAPSFTEQRDAILAAASAQDPADLAALASAFARRGFGSCAVSPASSATKFEGVVESFDVKAEPSITAATLNDAVLSCDADGILDAGEKGRAVVRISNAGSGALTGATLTARSTQPGVTFPNGATVTVPTLAAFSSTDVVVDVALDAGLVGAQQLSLELGLDAPGGCTTSSTFTLAVDTNVTVEPSSTATDDVEATVSAWTAKDLTPDASAKDVWIRSETSPFEHAFHGIDLDRTSDSAHESPAIVVGGASAFSVSFSHRYEFELDPDDLAARYDGGVVEISTDGGATWADVATLSTPSYDGPLKAEQEGTNPLKGRPSYNGRSAAWPARVTETLDFGTKLAGKTIKLRFRMGTDDGVGAFGWEIDDVKLTGAANTPFTSFVPDSACRPADAGSAGSNGSTSSSSGSTSGSSPRPGSSGSDADARGDAGPSPVAAPAEDGGCAMTSPGSTTSTSSYLGSTLLVLGIAAHARRSRRGRRASSPSRGAPLSVRSGR